MHIHSPNVKFCRNSPTGTKLCPYSLVVCRVHEKSIFLDAALGDSFEFCHGG